MMKKPLYTTGDIALLTMKNGETVREWCRKGRIRARKLGGEFAITDKALHEFLGDEIYHCVIDTLPPLPKDI